MAERSAVSGVGVLDKAVGILEALEESPCSLAELSRITGLPRATAHRLALALERHDLVDRDGSGRFVLGPALTRLATAAGPASRTLIDAAGPVLAELRDRTGESAQLYVPSGDRRVCVASLESPHSLRTIVPVGASLPMDRGSAGHVLSGRAAGRPWVQSVEEREKGVASVSAAVVVAGRPIAAMSVSGPLERMTRHPGRLYGALVAESARAVERRLGRPGHPGPRTRREPVGQPG